jgi:hypothetical protein
MLLFMALGASSPGCRSAATGGTEDPAIWAAESVGGVCLRREDLLDYAHPPWLKDVAGNPVVEVDLRRNPERVDDETLTKLAPLKDLHWLRLDGTRVTNNGLKELATLTQLRDLSLTRTGITDEGLKNLSRSAE